MFFGNPSGSFHGKLTKLCQNLIVAFNKKFLGKVSAPRTPRILITRKCSANAGTNFLKINFNLCELVKPRLIRSVKYPFRFKYLSFLAILGYPCHISIAGRENIFFPETNKNFPETMNCWKISRFFVPDFPIFLLGAPRQISDLPLFYFLIQLFPEP